MSYPSTLHIGSQESQSQQGKTEIYKYFFLQALIFTLKFVSAKFLLACFLNLKESTCETRFLFHFKSCFRSQENEISEIYKFKFHDVIKCLSTNQEIHFTESLGK